MSLLPVGRYPQVALDAKGDAVALWAYSTGLQVAKRLSGSDIWQTPVVLSGVGVWANEPQIAVDGVGDSIAVWTEYKNSDYVLEAAVMPGARGVWGPVVQLSPDGSSAAYPQVGMDAQGKTTVVWREYNHTTAPVVMAVTGSGSVATGNWQAPVMISSAGEEIGEALQVAVDHHDDAVALWNRRESTGQSVVAATRPGNDRGWLPAVRLSASGVWTVHPSLAVDAQGHAVAVWQVSTPKKISVQAALGSTTVGDWQAPITLATTSHESARKCSGPGISCPPGPPPAEPWVAMNARGDAVAVWEDSTGPRSARGIVQAALKKPGDSSWQTPVDLSIAGTSGPRVALDGQGDAVTVWTQASNGSSIVQTDTQINHLTIAGGSLSRTRLRISGQRHTSRDGGKGIRIRFVLSDAAQVQVTIAHLESGIRLGRRCEPVHTSVATSAKRCTRRTMLGMLVNRQEPQGAVSLHFDGALAGRLLKLGHYELVLTAHRNNEHSAQVKLPFTVQR